MKQAKVPFSLQHVKAVVWDYDGVHYDFADFPAWDSFDDICALSAMRHLPELSHAQARTLSIKGHDKYGDCVRIFTDWADERGHQNIAELRDNIFKGYHTDLFNSVVRDYPDHIKEHKPTIAAFRRCSPVLLHGIATNSSIEHWAKPLMTRQNILQFFNQRALIGLDNVGYRTKAESVNAIHGVLEALQTRPHEALFVEDSLKNLKFAHANIPGLTTIFICHGRPLQELPDYVSAQFKNPKTVLQAIAHEHGL